MLYDRKITREVIKKFDMELSCIEYKSSIYREVIEYLYENNCNQGVELINKLKEKTDYYVVTLKDNLEEIEQIFMELSKRIKKLYFEKKEIPKIISINRRKIFINTKQEKCNIIYSIGFDEYKNQYRYGIIKCYINKGNVYDEEIKIGFSSDGNLERYSDFKSYFYKTLEKFNEFNDLEKLNVLNSSFKKELSDIFFTDDLRMYLFENNKQIEKTLDISGVEILQELHQVYEFNEIRIKLFNNGYEIKNKKFIKLVKETMLNKQLLCKIQDVDDDMKEIYMQSINERNNVIEILKKEVKISSKELEIAVDKIQNK